MRDRDLLRLWFGLAFLTVLIGGCRPSPTQAPASSLPAPTLAVASMTFPPPTSTPTTLRTATSTVTPTLTATDTASLLPTKPPTPIRPTETPVSTETSSPPPPPTLVAAPTPTPTTARPAPTPTPRPKPPTPTPKSTYRFLPIVPAQPDPSHPCPGCPKAPAYIVGHVTDAAGHPLAGVRFVCYNEWHRYPVVPSKGGGEYDFAIIQADTTWYVVVLDQNDQPISPEAPVTVHLLESCRYILDWQRVD